MSDALVSCPRNNFKNVNPSMPGTAWGSLTESNYLSRIPWNGTDPLRASTGQPQKTVVNGKIVFCACTVTLGPR